MENRHFLLPLKKRKTTLYPNSDSAEGILERVAERKERQRVITGKEKLGHRTGRVCKGEMSRCQHLEKSELFS